MIRLVAVILLCLLLVGCSGQGGTANNDRRQAAGGSNSNTSEENTNNNNREGVRACHQEVGNEALINLVVIVGNRANTSEVPLGGAVDDIFCNLIGRTFEISNLEAEGNIAFVVSDGEPWRADVLDQNGRPANLRVSANNEYVLTNRIRNAISHTILPFMDSDHLMAQNEEADLFEALHIANRILRDMDPARENHILIIDSGITTTGHIDMREFNILEAGVIDVIVDRLEAASLLPDLQGVNISFFNIGGVAYPQQIHSGPIEDALVTFWYHILQATGAQVIHLQGRGEGGQARTVGNGYPFVSAVEFPAPDFDLSDLRSEVFSAEHLGFIADSSEFINEAYAINILSTTAEKLTLFLQSSPSNTVYIVGSQAVGPTRNTAGYILSQERAQRVKDLFISEFNLPEAQLISIGAGTTPLSWRNTDEFEAGVWRDELAEQNRVVAIIPSTAGEMIELRNNGFVD